VSAASGLSPETEDGEGGAVFLQPLAIEEPSRIIEMFTKDNKIIQTENLALLETSYPNFQDYRDRNQVLTGVAGYYQLGLPWNRNGQMRGVAAMLTSANYFDVLGVKPYRGRLFQADEDKKPGGDTVAVVSYSLWVSSAPIPISLGKR
jgi:hypothetical protein